MRTLIPSVVLLALVFLAGCGGASDKIVEVTGKVMHNGKPVSGLVVSFVPQTKNTSGASSGTTDQNGEFKLTVFNTGQSGAVAGPNKVWVSLPRKPPVKRAKGEPAPEIEIPADMAEILEKYGSLDKSNLTVEANGSPVTLTLD